MDRARGPVGGALSVGAVDRPLGGLDGDCAPVYLGERSLGGLGGERPLADLEGERAGGGFCGTSSLGRLGGEICRGDSYRLGFKCFPARRGPAHLGISAT